MRTRAYVTDDDDDGHQPCWNAPSRGQTVDDEENVQEVEEEVEKGAVLLLLLNVSCI